MFIIKIISPKIGIERFYNTENEEEQLSSDNMNNILSLPVVNPHDIVVFEIFQY